jgi:histidyl-tRNA synthetase
MIISKEPQRGTKDWLPDEFRIRKFIFDTWRDVCTSFGYKEYLTPLFEAADLYRAKSGGDVGGKELFILTDKAGRELAVRPEMTPSVTRMVSRIYPSAQKPIRLFSIANFIRNERPQRGRNREFWQLNFDVFGSDSICAEIETIEVAIVILQKLGAPAESFVVKLNNRKLIIDVVERLLQINGEMLTATVRLLDKWEKSSKENMVEQLSALGLSADQVSVLTSFIESQSLDDLCIKIPAIADSVGVLEVKAVIEALKSRGFGELVEFCPSLIRGFDYYDGTIFEVFDKHPDNNRAMFGGGRYNGLASIFGVDAFPAVGCAPGDEPTRLFLESWKLVDGIAKSVLQTVYLPLLSEDPKVAIAQASLAQVLRQKGFAVSVGFAKQGRDKAIAQGRKQESDFVVLLSEQELESKEYVRLDVKSGEFAKVSLRLS